jgi:hypothetical protein
LLLVILGQSYTRKILSSESHLQIYDGLQIAKSLVKGRWIDLQMIYVGCGGSLVTAGWLLVMGTWILCGVFALVEA